MLCSVSTCDFIQSIAAKSRLQVQKCLKYLNLFVMYPFSCQLLPLFEYTKYQTLTPTSRVHYSPKPLASSTRTLIHAS